MKVLIFGGRDVNEEKAFDFLLQLDYTAIDVVIEGGAKGADRAGRKFGLFREIPVETYNADWKKYGKSAGPIRNQVMIETGKPDIAIMFPGGNGTGHMMSLCI